MRAFERNAAIALGLLGAVLAVLPADSLWARFSYEIPFLLRHDPKPEIIVIYEDDQTRTHFQTPPGQTLGRAHYAALLKNLSLARIVAFDVVFSRPTDPESDRKFLNALEEQGPPVVLAASLNDQVQGGVRVRQIEWPHEPFRDAADAVGLIQLQETPSGVHRVYESDLHPSFSWETARLLGARITENHSARRSARWLNYYGPSGGRGPRGPIAPTFLSLGLSDALITTNEFFKDKIVFVGVNVRLDSPDARKDAFATPYSAHSSSYDLAPGVDIHATATLNLFEGAWLNRIHPLAQSAICFLFGASLVLTLVRISPAQGFFASAGIAALLVAGSMMLHLKWNLWWTWFIPVAIQVPGAYILAIGHHYTVELAKRRRYRKAFAAYLSPYMADKLAEQGTRLSLGGELVKATILFTDLEGFTSMSEKLPPDKVADILTTYFNRTTSHILDNGGTITKYIGDAVMAIWGAPVPDARQADHAVQAALGMIRAGAEPIAGFHLNTRIGIHSGQVLVGNLGSHFRFDYTAIGDNVNLASRLEGLNKLFGSKILISGATAKQLGQTIPLRPMGKFVVVGKSEAIELFQVSNATDSLSTDQLTRWNRALELFAARDFDASRQLLEQITLPDGKLEGGARFYLDQIARLGDPHQLPASWKGEITITSK